MEAMIRDAGRTPRQRTTLYGDAPAEQVTRSFGAAGLAETVNHPVLKRARIGSRKALAEALIAGE
jgi:FO synthase